MSLIFAGKVPKGERGFSHGKFDKDESARRDLVFLDQSERSRVEHRKSDVLKRAMNKGGDLGNVRNMFFQPLAKKHLDSNVASVLPIGHQTEVVTAVEAIKELFPHTTKRLPKETMRNHLFQK
jgi:hypothetical protein